MANSSRWRIEARRVIYEALSRLPRDATAQEKHVAISAAYPFGARANHPYRMWLAEVRQMLPHRRRDDARIYFDKYGVNCPVPVCQGCLLCSDHRKRLEAWRTWNNGVCVKIAQRIRDEKRIEDMPILADALEEAGCTEDELLADLRAKLRGAVAVSMLLAE